ncbi:MAG: hypothetical protein JKX68_13530 [Flavobacteriales bacterium]|nr:hypothetical protein [Flavobacteriales bacterium]
MKYLLSLLLLILFVILSYGQDTLCQKKITESEILAQNCLDEYFSQNKVNKEKFITSFEDYFINNKLVENKNGKGELYWNILKYIEVHPDKMPSIEKPYQIIEVAKKLKLTIPNLIKYDQLKCIQNEYKIYNISCKKDTNSTFAIFGDIAKSLPENPNIHYSLIASTLRLFTTPKKLEEKIYQENIVMLFWFQLANFYGKWE